MKLGFALPQVGSAADPALIGTAVRRAEQLGYSSGWVNDRLLWPTAPKAPYPASPICTMIAANRIIDHAQ